MSKSSFGAVVVLVGCLWMPGCGAMPRVVQHAHADFSEPAVVELARAACAGEGKKVEKMAAAGIDVDAVGRAGMTPLRFAVACGSVEGVKALLKAGADPNASDAEGVTAVWLAAGFNSPDVLRALVDAGGDLHVVGRAGETVLMRALGLGIESFEAWGNYYLLLERGVDINQAVRRGRTIAWYAEALGRFDKVAELLERGYSYDLLSVAWGTENRAVPADRQPDVDRVKALLKERGVKWPIPHPLDDANRIAYMQANPDYAAKHPESWPR